MAMGVSYCLWPFVVLIKILKNASAGINMESGTELMRSKILKPCLEIQVLGSKTIQELCNDFASALDSTSEFPPSIF